MKFCFQALTISIRYFYSKTINEISKNIISPFSCRIVSKKGKIDKRTKNMGDSGFSDSVLQDLLKAMEVKKIYMDPNINLERVCRELGTNRTYLSKKIKENFNIGFCNFVNSYRLKVAEKMLEDEKYKGYSLRKIAENSGFKNYSNFNKLFKKQYGTTPGNYKKRRQLRDMNT